MFRRRRLRSRSHPRQPRTEGEADGRRGATFDGSGGGLDVALICSGTGRKCDRSCARTCDPSTCRMKGDLDVTFNGQQSGFVCTAEVRLPSVAGLSDAEIAAALVDRFRAQGVDADVVVQNGSVVSLTPNCSR